MPGIRQIDHDGVVHAVVLDSSGPLAPGITFVTPTSYPLQVGLMNHPAGTAVRPHIHRDRRYDVNTTQEFVYVKSGLVEVVVYTDAWEELERLRLTDGQFVLFVRGGHELTVLEDSEMVEVKQGPYPGDAEAKVFREQSGAGVPV